MLHSLFAAPPTATGQRVATNATVNVRSTAAGTNLGTQTSGSQGLVTNGPTTASLAGTSYTWWLINFDSGVDGWVASIGIDTLVGPPSAPSSLEAQAFSNRVLLGWSDNSSNETGFKIERRTGSGSYSQIATTGANSGNDAFYTDNTTAPRTTYSYRVRSYNANGDSAYTGVVTLTTPGGPPGSFTLSNGTPVWDAAIPGPKIQLNWTASSDVGGYTVYRNNSLYAAVTGNSYVNSANLSAGSTYTYFIRASNADGITDSNTISVTMPQAPLTIPAAPGVLEAQAFSNRVELGWEDNSTNETGFKIERRIGNGSYSQTATIGSNSDNNAFYTDITTSPKTSYTYRVRAYNGAGDSSYSSSVTLTTPGGSPGSFTLSNGTPVWDANIPGPKVQLNWTDSTDAGGYAVYRNGTLYNAAFTGTSFLNNSNLTGGNTYTYFIRASNADGQTDSNTISVTMPSAPGGTGPTVNGVNPNSLVGSASPQTITVTGTNFIQGSRIQVAYTSNGYSFVDTNTAATFVNSTTLTVPIITTTAVDTWRVRVWNPGGQTSNFVNLTITSQGGGGSIPTILSPGTPSDSGSAVPNLTPAFTWTQVSGAARYAIAISKQPYGPSNVVYSNNYLTGQSFQIPSGSLLPGTKYRWQLAAVNSSGVEGTSSGLLYFQTPATSQVPAAPTTLVVLLAPSGFASMAWNDNSSNETNFRIERKTGNGNWAQIATTGANIAAYQDHAITAGNFYTYRVLAYNSFGSSGSTQEVAVNYPASGPLTVLVTNPTSSSSWSSGSSQSISWLTTGLVQQIGYFTVSYSLNGGSTFTRIIPNPSASANTLNWLIPSNLSSVQAKIKVSAFNSAGVELTNGTTPAFSILTPVMKPVAVPDVNNSGPFAGALITFNGSASRAPAGRTITSYQWNFGDGGSGSGPTIAHSYSQVGSYSARLTVTDSAGETDSRTLAIRVSGKSLGAEVQSSLFADPVNLATGNFILSVDDIEFPGMGFPLKFSRFYNSKDATNDGLPIGHHWTHSYNLEIIEPVGGAVTIRFGDGRQEIHSPAAGGGYTAEPGVHDRLEKVAPDQFNLRSKDQMVYQFSSGRLESIRDRNNNTQILEYNPAGQLVKVTDTSGRFLEFSYNPEGRVSVITDPLSRTVQYGYGPAGDLITVTNPRNGVTRYTYDALHQILTATDPNNNVFVTNEYDESQRVVSSQRDALGNRSAFLYDFPSGLTTVTDPFGHVTKHLHDKNLRLIAKTNELNQTESYEYDDNNNRTAVISRNGHATRYSYDALGNVTSKIDPLGSRTIIEYNSRNDPVFRTDAISHAEQIASSASSAYGTAFEYDERGNLTRSTDAKGRFTIMTYNASGKILTLTDRRNNVTNHEYDAAGNRVKSTDALNGVARATFDAVGRMRTSVNQNLHTTHFDYDPSDHVLTVRNPLDHTTTNEYDPNGNRTLLRDPMNGTTRFEYDAKDRLVKVTDAMGGIVRHEYDAYDRKTKTIDARGFSTTFEYDPAGRLSASVDATGLRTAFTYDANGNRVSVIDPLGKISRSTYDPLDRLVTSTDALGNTTTFEYDRLGQKTSVRDALGRFTRSEFDQLGKLVKVTDAAGGIVRYTYDEEGNRTGMSNPRSKFTMSFYDKLNRLNLRAGPAGNIERYAYDAVGNLVQRIDAKNQTVEFVYDSANRLTRINYPAGAPVIFTYDANGNRTQMQDTIGTSQYAFDALNRMTSYSSPFAHTVAYEYDAASNRKALVYPGNKRVEYTYDNAGRMLSVKDWGNRTTAYQYDPAGRLSSTQNPNGTAATQTYDDAGRLATLRNTRPGGAIISRYAYTMDAVGNYIEVDQEEPVEPMPNLGAFSYSYDDEDRIQEMEGIPQRNDANGNLTGSGPDLQLTYDFENRLVRQQTTDSDWNWRYDGTGKRLERNWASSPQRFVLDVNTPLTQVIGIADEAGAIFEYFVYGLGLVSKIDQAGNATYYHYDSRGSTIAMTDQNAASTATFAYDPFGRLVGRAPADAIDSFTFLGRHGVMNDYNGFYFVRARHYSSRRGRFLSKDPIWGIEEDSQSLNRFVYGLNNPIALVDINGFFATKTFFTGVGQVAASYATLGLSVVSLIMDGASKKPVALLSGTIGTLDGINESTRYMHAGTSNLVGAFRDQAAIPTEEGVGVYDEALKNKYIKFVRDANQVYGTVNILRNPTKAATKAVDGMTDSIGLLRGGVRMSDFTEAMAWGQLITNFHDIAAIKKDAEESVSSISSWLQELRNSAVGDGDAVTLIKKKK